MAPLMWLLSAQSNILSLHSVIAYLLKTHSADYRMSAWSTHLQAVGQTNTYC